VLVGLWCFGFAGTRRFPQAALASSTMTWPLTWAFWGVERVLSGLEVVVVWEVLFAILGVQEAVPGPFELVALGSSTVTWQSS
jgi:hypothetical protein